MVNTIRYAENTVLTIDNMKDLQDLLKTIGNHKKNLGLNINTKKTEFVMVSPKAVEQQNANLTQKISNKTGV